MPKDDCRSTLTLAAPQTPQTVPPARPSSSKWQRAAFLQRPVRHARIGQRVGQGKQIIHTEQASVPVGAAFIGHAASVQAAHRVEAAERVGNEANFVLKKTNFV